MNNPKVTVLMTVFNGEKYLREAIESILFQTYKDFEFLIINDGSTDSSRNIILSYEDPRIQIFDNEKNLGFPASLNRGLQIARGEYIARMDADDISMPERLEKEIEVLEKNNDIGLVACWVSIIDEGKKIFSTWEADRLNNSSEEIYYTLNFENCLAHSSVVFRKDLVIKIGGYDANLRIAPDYDLWIRVSKITKIAKHQEVLVFYRRHGTNISLTENDLLKREVFQIYLKNSNVNVVKSEIIFNIANNLISNNNNNNNNNNNKIQTLICLFKINHNIISHSPIIYRKNEIRRFARKKYFYIFKNFKYIIIAWRKFKKLYNSDHLRYLRELKNYCIYAHNDSKVSKKILDNIEPKENKINILFIVPYMVMGGSEKVNLNILANINKRFEFHFITTNKFKNVWEKYFKQYTNNIYHLPVLFHTGFKQFIINYIKKMDIDIVLISNSLYGYHIVPDIKKKYPHIKIIDIIHNEAFNPYIYNRDEYFDNRITISDHLKEKMIFSYSFNPEKIITIKNGISLNEYDKDKYQFNVFKNKYNIAKTDFVVSYVGRLSPEKHPEYIVEIANRICNYDKKTEFRFLIAGDGELFEEIQNKIIKYKLIRNVFLVGRIENIQEFLNDTNILLVTSEIEGIPFNILEAMYMEIPVISTNVGAISEIIENNINGYLIKYDKDSLIDEFVDRIYLLKNNDGMYYSISRNGKEKIIKEFSMNNISESYDNLFRSLLGKK